VFSRCWLAAAPQSASKLYMVMDFAQGGDFFALLRRFGRLREPAARVYVSEVALALSHVHDHGVIYRDLKVGAGRTNDDGGNE
jgi:serine/threonine protein kinase